MSVICEEINTGCWQWKTNSYCVYWRLIKAKGYWKKNGEKLHLLRNIQAAKASRFTDTLGVRAQESVEHSVIEGWMRNNNGMGSSEILNSLKVCLWRNNEFCKPISSIQPQKCCTCMEPDDTWCSALHQQVQGGSNMTGTDVARFTHKQSRSYFNHLVQTNPKPCATQQNYGGKSTTRIR